MNKAILISAALSASPAFSHPGHEAAIRDGDAHWLTQTDHLVIVLLAAALVALVVAQVLLRGRRPTGDRAHGK